MHPTADLPAPSLYRYPILVGGGALALTICTAFTMNGIIEALHIYDERKYVHVPTVS